MAEVSEEERDEKGLLKYRFLEDFKDLLEAETGKEVKLDSPKIVETELYGKLELHRLAKIKWTKTEVKQVYKSEDGKGNVEREEKTVAYYEEHLGELGGWAERPDNLSQGGKCWVKDGAFVVGNASVFGDAEIGAEVEIGDYARVGGEAKVSGPTGIGEDCAVFGKAEIVGKRKTSETESAKKIFSVYGEASVEGKVNGCAEVYGSAVVGEDGEVTGEAKVYGEALVDGKVSDKAEVFGKAEVYGEVKKACVFGNAVIGENGSVEGGEETNSEGKTYDVFSFVDTGTIDGQMVRTDVRRGGGAILFVGKGSHIEKCTLYAGVYYIGEDCYLHESDLHGIVNLAETTARKSIITDSTVSKSEMEMCWLTRSIVSGTTIEGDPIFEYKITDSRLENGHFSKHDDPVMHYNKEGDADGFTNPYISVGMTHGIPPKDAHYHNASLNGVTNIRYAEGEDIPYSEINSITKAEGFDTALKPVTPPVKNTYEYPVEIDAVHGRDSNGDVYVITPARTEMVEATYGWDYKNFGEETLGPITIVNDHTNKWHMDEFLKGEKEKKEKADKAAAKLKEREDWLQGIEDNLNKRMEGNYQQREQVGKALQSLSEAEYDDSNFPQAQYDALVAQINELSRKNWLTNIAVDVVDTNKYAVSVALATDALWEKIKGAIQSTVGSLGSSVTPYYAFTPIWGHTQLEDEGEGREQALTGSGEDRPGDKCVLDFTQPRVLPTITDEYVSGCKFTWVVSDYIAESPIRTSYTPAYAEYLYADRGDGAKMSFNDLIEYTEKERYGLETVKKWKKYREYKEADELYLLGFEEKEEDFGPEDDSSVEYAEGEGIAEGDSDGEETIII